MKIHVGVLRENIFRERERNIQRKREIFRERNMQREKGNIPRERMERI